MLNTNLFWYVQKGLVKMIKQTNVEVLFEDSKQDPQTSKESVTTGMRFLRNFDAWPGTCHAIFSFASNRVTASGCL